MSAQVSLTGQILSVMGELTFANAHAVYQQGQRLLQQQPAKTLTIDLAGLTHSNTLTLAVLVQWIRGLPNARVGLTHVPDKLIAIIHASNLAQLLSSADQ